MFVFVAWVLMFLVGAALDYLIARLLGVKGATFGRALLASLVGSTIGFVLSAVLGGVPVLGLLVPLLGLLGSLWALKYFFKTDWQNAFLIWLLSLVFTVVLVVVILVVAILLLV